LLAAAPLARLAGRDSWAGGALGAASLRNFLLAAVAPALWRGRWRLLTIAAIAIVAL
jgi:hypothetical protein